ncbi:MAG: hypothetical protein KJ838_05885 [Candidatus Omnitrophica bacterium]|nr:hypothetical protein [Candidatus Omnitrophota bacterium]
MSIIYDALKKVQGQEAGENKAGPNSSRQDSSKSPRKNYIIAFLLLVIVSIIFTSRFISIPDFSFKDIFTRKQNSSKNQTEVSDKNAFYSASSTADLSLQGIFYSEGKYTALINDEIVEVGDRIGEAEVLEITQKGVEVAFKGLKVYLEYP